MNRLAVKPGKWVPEYIPKGYTLRDFQRYEVYEDYVVGVLYSGKLVYLQAGTTEDTLTWLQKLRQAWRNLWLQEK